MAIFETVYTTLMGNLINNTLLWPLGENNYMILLFISSCLLYCFNVSHCNLGFMKMCIHESYSHWYTVLYTTSVVCREGGQGVGDAKKQQYINNKYTFCNVIVY